jgi:hypothetical protein
MNPQLSQKSKMSGNEPRCIEANGVLGTSGGIEPDVARVLADVVVAESHGGAMAVALDFTGINLISSGFANAFFLSLQRVRPLSEWRETLSFVGLGSLQAEILRRSLHAAQNLKR